LKKAMIYLQGEPSKNIVPDFCIWMHLEKHLFLFFLKMGGMVIFIHIHE
jgi:hypothetical protein